MTILVTGGAGYIGSHCSLTFLEAGHDIVVLDNLENSSTESLARVGALAGRSVTFEKADVRDTDRVERILRTYNCTAVIHFAGLKVMGDSLNHPLAYYDTNVAGSLSLLSAMSRSGIREIIFSSTAAVYGEPRQLPVPEAHPRQPENPYGRSKLIVEEIIRDLCQSDSSWRAGILRYFNPVGAHASGLIGENPLTPTNNLMPLLSAVAGGRAEKLKVFGNDYDTPDGTGVRDYIHVVDLVEGHLRAYEALFGLEHSDNCFAVNLGTGTGYSVLQMVKAFERASNKQIPYEIVGRRLGDVAACYADTVAAEQTLGWKARFGLEDMCADTWNWVCKNPRGYGGHKNAS
ncbi:UDP-glucose 4-epimerase GalE [Roseibium denhamense]|uniref:UDP-glucose 4-epimerase n=1 Tax=Roseibium denhamense TaxID=76305 RepID=A0ABY1PNG4_9HYPH|nr:UDP-glucose 4-epimerase GalE [Roseibium denhamense]MTI04115.1 UDP-glucose 4-epimerase GalE [Roseibium denhamense]SMP37352.1 UDP-galactose 4-epimerase [Roseibium denhamense]